MPSPEVAYSIGPHAVSATCAAKDVEPPACPRHVGPVLSTKAPSAQKGGKEEQRRGRPAGSHCAGSCAIACHLLLYRSNYR